MGRAAGSGTHYEFTLRNNSTGRYDRSRTIALPSVTTIIKQTLAAPALIAWTYRETRDIIASALSMVQDVASDEDGMSIMDIFTDADVLEEFLKENKLRPDDQVEAGGDLGTEGHDFMEQLAKAYLEVDEDAARRIAELIVLSHEQGHKLAIAKWWLERNPMVLASEAMVFSLRHGYAGTLDLVWKNSDGEVVLTDLKNRKEGRGAYESDDIQTGAYKIAWQEMFGEVVNMRTVLVARADGTWVEEASTIDETVFLHLLEVWKGIKTKGGV